MNEDKDFFEKNLNAFRKFLPDLANIFENYSPESTLFQHEDGGRICVAVSAVASAA